MFFHYGEKDFVGDCFQKEWMKAQLGKQALLKISRNLFLNSALSVLLKILLNLLMVFLNNKAKNLKQEAALKKKKHKQTPTVIKEEL